MVRSWLNRGRIGDVINNNIYVLLKLKIIIKITKYNLCIIKIKNNYKKLQNI